MTHSNTPQIDADKTSISQRIEACEVWAIFNAKGYLWGLRYDEQEAEQFASTQLGAESYAVRKMVLAPTPGAEGEAIKAFGEIFMCAYSDDHHIREGELIRLQKIVLSALTPTTATGGDGKALGDFTLNEIIATAKAAGETGQIGLWKRRVKEFAVQNGLADREAIALVQLGPDIEKHFRAFYPPISLHASPKSELLCEPATTGDQVTSSPSPNPEREALMAIRDLGSDGEHSGDRHARCRDIARKALGGEA
jgi:hypothetical protein